jgi:hypothetical protein
MARKSVARAGAGPSSVQALALCAFARRRPALVKRQPGRTSAGSHDRASTGNRHSPSPIERTAAQNDQIGAPRLETTNQPTAAPIGGYARVLPHCACHLASQRGWDDLGQAPPQYRSAWSARGHGLLVQLPVEAAFTGAFPAGAGDQGHRGMTSGSYPQQLLPDPRGAVGAMGADERLSQSVPRRLFYSFEKLSLPGAPLLNRTVDLLLTI